MKASLLLVAIGNIYGLNIRAATTNLDAFNTQSLDNAVRQQMIKLVQQKASSAKTEQTAADLKCSQTINSTIDGCNECAKSKCGQSGESSGNLWTFLGSSIETGITYQLPHLLASGADKVLGGLKDLGGKIGDGLSSGTDAIKHGAETALSGLTHTATDIGNQIKHGAESVVSGIKDVGSSIGHAVSHIFGKRLDSCVAGCPSCVKIDSDTKSQDQILVAVCGTDYVTKTKQRTDAGTKLQAFYNAAAGHSIISKVEYDPTSIDVTQGVAFKTVFVTANLKGTPTRFQSKTLMKLTDIPSWSVALTNELYGMM